MAFKTSEMDQIALEYWYYGSLGRLRVDGRVDFVVFLQIEAAFW